MGHSMNFLMGLSFGLPVLLVLSQNVAAQPNDQRSPIAQIDPSKPIQIRVVSQTNIPVEASIVPAVGFRTLLPGQSITFGRLHTKFLSLPLDLQVTNPNAGLRLGIFLDVQTRGNEVIVGVKTQRERGNGTQSLDIDAGGNIYRF